MIPDKKEWSSWSSIEKATYLAQSIFVPASLLVTILFSYFGWQEARVAQQLARISQEQERSFFIAQNPPKLEIEAGRVLDSDRGPILFLWIKNIGDSAAKAPCADVGRLNGSYLQSFTENCSTSDPNSRVMVAKGESVTYHVPQEGFLNFRPRKIRILRPNEPTPADIACSGEVDMLMVTVRYKDILDAPQAILRQVQLCK